MRLRLSRSENSLGGNHIQEETVLAHKRVVQNNLHHLLGRDTRFLSLHAESPLGVGLGALEAKGVIGHGAVGGRDRLGGLESKFTDGRIAVADVVEGVVVSSRLRPVQCHLGLLKIVYIVVRMKTYVE